VRDTVTVAQSIFSVFVTGAGVTTLVIVRVFVVSIETVARKVYVVVVVSAIIGVKRP
jgi:hypothetical protein